MDNKKLIQNFINPNLIPAIILLLIPLIGTFFGLIILLTTTIPAWSRAKKSIAALESRGELDQAAAELISPNCKKLIKEKIVLTDNYVFCKRTGMVFTCDEILWAYKHRQTTTFFFIPIMVTDSLYLATKSLKPSVAASMSKDKKEEIKAAIIEIYTHNNSCLVGYSGETAAKYKALTKK